MTIKHILALAGMAAYALATIGGFGFSVWGGSWVCGISVLVLAAMAFPVLKKCYTTLTT